MSPSPANNLPRPPLQQQASGYPITQFQPTQNNGQPSTLGVSARSNLGVPANQSANVNVNNSALDNSQLNLLDQSRGNASQAPVYEYGRQFNNSSMRA